MYKVRPLLNVIERWQQIVPELCRRGLRFLVGPQKAVWSGTQRYEGHNPTKGALVKIQEMSVPATGGFGSLYQCVCGKSTASRAFFRVGLGTLLSIKFQSIFFNGQHKQRNAVLARGGGRSTQTGSKLIQVSKYMYIKEAVS